MSKPLRDLKVLEMGAFITGPAAAMLLGDMGADVIKIERPGGDPFRAFRKGLYSPHFQTYNRNKRSVVLDTKDGKDLAELDRLVGDADVFIQNFRPGVASRLSIGADRLMALNPRLIYCGISGFGADGPDRDRPAYDTVAQAASGFMRLLIDRMRPRVAGPAIADAMTGFYAALGIVSALHERNRTGLGGKVETSMFEAMCHFNLDDFTHYFAAGELMDSGSRPRVSQSYVFECGDGGLLALHMSSPDKFWDNLAAAVGLPDMFEDPRFADRAARIANYDAVVEFLAPLFRQRTRDEWARRLRALDVPSSPVHTPDEVLRTDQARHLQLAVEAEHPVMGPFRSIRFPVTFGGVRDLPIVPPPILGEHDLEIKGPRGTAGGPWASRRASS